MSDHTPDPSTRRVVVTGLGAVTPLGLSVEAFWNALLRGESGARPIESFDASAFHTRFACEVRGFDPLAYFDRKKARHLDPFCHYAVAASDEAFWTSQFDLHHPEHLAQGLMPHGCFERWYFGRSVSEVTDVVDVQPVLDRKIEAALSHECKPNRVPG